MKRMPTLFTTKPDIPAPALLCPTCDKPLIHRQSVFNGLTPRERWDYFACPTCRGGFEYRERTRRLKPTQELSLIEFRAR
jgi:predicted RNA-binding Zn-ribbon protein involved in translation (DUF1610 family)